MQNFINVSQLESEIQFTTSRSSGPGGQNVNKVNSKVTARFDIRQSRVLSPQQKETLLAKLASSLTGEGVLILSSQDKRSQLQNKEAVLAKLERALNKALEKKKKRKASKPTKAAKEKRIMQKKRHGEKKQWRQKF